MLLINNACTRFKSCFINSQFSEVIYSLITILPCIASYIGTWDGYWVWNFEVRTQNLMCCISSGKHQKESEITDRNSRKSYRTLNEVQNVLTCIPPTSISSDGFMIRFSIVTPWAVATSCIPLCAMVLAAMASNLVPISSITIAWGIWFSTASISTWLIRNKQISIHSNSKFCIQKNISIQCTYKLVQWPS